MDNNFQQQPIRLEKARLAFEEGKLALEEMKFTRPSLSVPILLPEESCDMVIV